MGLMKKALCKHEKEEYLYSNLVREEVEGVWCTQHVWKCKRCGKIRKTSNKQNRF